MLPQFRIFMTFFNIHSNFAGAHLNKSSFEVHLAARYKYGQWDEDCKASGYSEQHCIVCCHMATYAIFFLSEKPVFGKLTQILEEKKKKLQRSTGRACHQKTLFPKLSQIVTGIIKTLISDTGVCNNKGS